MSMRPVVPILAAVLAAAALAAPAPAWVRLGPEGGASYAGVTGSLFGALFDKESASGPAWSAGLAVDVPLQDRLTFATGLRYAEFGEQVEVTLVSTLPTDPPGYLYGTFTFHNTWRYLALPARVKYEPWAGRGLFVSLGPEVGYLLDVVTEVEGGTRPVVRATGLAAAPGGTIFEQLGTYDDFRHFYERWNVALVGGLGWTFPLARHEGVVEVRFSEGIVDMAKSSSVAQRTRGLEAALGMRW